MEMRGVQFMSCISEGARSNICPVSPRGGANAQWNVSTFNKENEYGRKKKTQCRIYETRDAG
jgi:hypothetical protein